MEVRSAGAAGSGSSKNLEGLPRARFLAQPEVRDGRKAVDNDAHKSVGTMGFHSVRAFRAFRAFRGRCFFIAVMRNISYVDWSSKNVSL
jgi:hypothetical protein